MNTQAREYIVHALRDMGLRPEVQAATVHRQTMDDGHNVHVTLAVVHNIVVRKRGAAPGHASRPALLVATHYDSDADTFGAADGAASPAAMLETLRALQAAPPLEDDVVFLFADGDKIGKLGEQAFVQRHRFARRIGTTLKFSNLGNHGPLYLYDTHGAAGDAISRWASAAPQPHGSSFMRQLHRSSGAGIGPLSALDAPVLQLATVQGWLGIYDTPGRLDPASLQHEGDTMLALVRDFSSRQTARRADRPDMGWFPLPLIGMVLYPAWLAWPATLLPCLVLTRVCREALRRGHVDLRTLVQGTFGFVLIAAAPVAVLFIAGPQAPLFDMARDPASGLPSVRHLAVDAALMAGLCILLQRWLRKVSSLWAAALGALVAIALLLVAASWAMPASSYLLAWPLIAVTASLAGLQSRRAATLPQPFGLALLVTGLAPAVVIFMSTVRDVLAVPAAPRLLLAIGLLALLLGLSLLVLALLARLFAARTLLLTGLALFALPGTASVPAQPPPRPNPLVYYKDMPTWSEWWLARSPVLDDWTRHLFAWQPKPRRLVDVFGWDSDDLWYTRAPDSASVSFPYAIQLSNETVPTRRIEFDLTSKNRAPNIELRLQGGKPWRVLVNGMEITNDNQIRNWSLSVYGMEDKKLHFVLDLIGDPYLGVLVQERMPGVPHRALQATMPEGEFIPGTGQTITADMMWFR